MRRVFLEQNLGKKSKSRFPRRNPKKVIIKLTIESQRAVSTPSLTQPLVISGVNVMEFCERFNQESINMESGLKVSSKVIVISSTKTFDLEIKTPSVFEMMKRIFQQESVNNISKKINILTQVIHNMALIKILLIGNNFYKKNLTSHIKEIAGNLRSYEDFRVSRKKNNKNKLVWQRINN